VPHEFVVYPREPHLLEERNHLIDYHRRIRDWFDRWLGPGATESGQAME
jgi:dipeptidyl aminopeptidase/acylaminoacyl peptidase